MTSTPFHDLDAYIALPRLSGLAYDPAGGRLFTVVATLDDKKAKYVSSIWQLDAAGKEPARRVTRSKAGESSPVVTCDGDLLFISARPDPDGPADDEAPAALWMLPAGGEARVIATWPGGIGEVVAARAARRIIVGADTLATSSDAESEERLRTARKDGKITAMLHDGYPVRYWDHDLGPGGPRLYAGDLAVLADADAGEQDTHVPLKPLTPAARSQMIDAAIALTPDGSTVLTTWMKREAKGESRFILKAIDTTDGTERIVYDDPDHEPLTVAISPDGSRAALIVDRICQPELAPHPRLAIVELATGECHDVCPDWDRWPTAVTWTPDGTALLVTADEDGAGPIFRAEVDGLPTVTRVTSDDGVYSEVQVDPKGKTAFALRTSYLRPPEVVAVDLGSGKTRVLAGPAAAPELPGRLERVSAEASDGTPIHGYLALPEDSGGQGSVPLLLWIHGGPLSSWNAWSWRWNPWLLVAQGYAVLLPDPALSTGYGQGFIERGWNRWGAEPFTDLMAITDAVTARPDIDETRTAAMGGSFGGYMANWVAGHTDRFRAIVTHASLWALDQFGVTTDVAYYTRHEMSPESVAEYDPAAHVSSIVTPMLVVHGDHDYRVPIGEGLRLWYQLLADSAGATDADGVTAHRFLYFPSEGHWVLAPQHAKIWYQVVENFLATHVLGDADNYPLPDLLG